MGRSGASAADLRQVLDLVTELHRAEGDPVTRALPEINRLVGGDGTAFIWADHRRGRLLGAVTHPQASDWSRDPRFLRVVGQHPAFRGYREKRVREGTSVTISDLMDRPTFTATELYADFYRVSGTQDQLLNPVRISASRGAVLSVNRSRRGASGRDRELLNLLAPHLGNVLAQRDRLARLTAAVRTVGRETERIAEAAPLLDRLTPREREVVTCAARGLSDRAISLSLGMGVRTVHKHLERIYRKLGINNRTSLVAAVNSAT